MAAVRGAEAPRFLPRAFEHYCGFLLARDLATNDILRRDSGEDLSGFRHWGGERALER